MAPRVFVDVLPIQGNGLRFSNTHPPEEFREVSTVVLIHWSLPPAPALLDLPIWSSDLRDNLSKLFGRWDEPDDGLFPRLANDLRIEWILRNHCVEILFAACASRTPKKIVVVSAFAPGNSVDEATVRRPKEVRQYRFGRYVDAGTRLVRHEAHPVYRIERAAGWNLRPDGSTKSTSALATAPVASSPPDDALVAEMNKQEAATKGSTE